MGREVVSQLRGTANLVFVSVVPIWIGLSYSFSGLILACDNTSFTQGLDQSPSRAQVLHFQSSVALQAEGPYFSTSLRHLVTIGSQIWSINFDDILIDNSWAWIMKIHLWLIPEVQWNVWVVVNGSQKVCGSPSCVISGAHCSQDLDSIAMNDKLLEN